ncbi:HNH endonuclease [Halanaeroarchaeum sulfurireducens]|uniref:HNH endonuclease n=1 Tax=Halanaeroarchaeum sulfurireducens TaxID=1604004 RepID=UPI0009AC9B2B|nr:HNH endonuclease signature motif containing protein [Halanaeroarchaeum sulfurireducens]
MGVVRREGDWRLEKHDEGLYKITYQRDVQLKVLTPDHSPGSFENPTIDTVPVHEVGSYEEAKGLFEEKAHDGAPSSIGLSGENQMESIDTNPDQGVERELDAVGEELEDIDAPPGVIAIALIIVGGGVLSTQGWQPTESVFQVGALMAVGGLLILAWGVVVGKSNGWNVAKEFLFESESGSSSSQKSGSDSDVRTTPPPSEKTKNTLIFERADQRCEWCGDRSDHLEVHHIEPRSEGGSNEPDNLIVLCPNHHRQADKGGISKTKLKAKVRRLPEVSVE